MVLESLKEIKPQNVSKPELTHLHARKVEVQWQSNIAFTLQQQHTVVQNLFGILKCIEIANEAEHHNFFFFKTLI